MAKPFTTGIEAIDQHLSKGQQPQLVVLGSRPGGGKTALAVQIADHALRQGQRVLYFSLEMSGVEMQVRFLSTRTGISLRRMRQGLSDQERGQLEVAQAELEGFLTLDSNPRVSVGLLRSVLGAGRNYDLVIIDYLQLVEVGSDSSPLNAQKLAALGSSLKGLMAEFGCSILALSQVNRSLDEDNEKLRLSGAFEQDADLIMLLRQPSTLEVSDTKRTLSIAKNRRGALGAVNLIADFERQRFTPTERFEGEQPAEVVKHWRSVSKILSASLTPKGIDQWWNTPNSILGSQKPGERLQSGDFEQLEAAAQALIKDFRI